MFSKVIQDWITVERTYAVLSPTRVVQSADRWLVTEQLQDASFYVEVKYGFLVGGVTAYLRLETAPSRDEALFTPITAPLNLPGQAGTYAVVPAYAHSCSGPPLAKYLRWVVDSQDSTRWLVCFRITMAFN